LNLELDRNYPESYEDSAQAKAILTMMGLKASACSTLGALRPVPRTGEGSGPTQPIMSCVFRTTGAAGAEPDDSTLHVRASRTPALLRVLISLAFFWWAQSYTCEASVVGVAIAAAPLQRRRRHRPGSPLRPVAGVWFQALRVLVTVEPEVQSTQSRTRLLY
jgi:hypothetical protein